MSSEFLIAILRAYPWYKFESCHCWRNSRPNTRLHHKNNQSISGKRSEEKGNPIVSYPARYFGFLHFHHTSAIDEPVRNRRRIINKIAQQKTRSVGIAKGPGLFLRPLGEGTNLDVRGVLLHAWWLGSKIFAVSLFVYTYIHMYSLKPLVVTQSFTSLRTIIRQLSRFWFSHSFIQSRTLSDKNSSVVSLSYVTARFYFVYEKFIHVSACWEYFSSFIQ